MIPGFSIRRFCKALLEAAELSDSLDTVARDLAVVSSWMEKAPAFHVFVVCDSLGLKAARQQALADLAREASLHPVTAGFLCVLEKAGAIRQLPKAIATFNAAYRARAGQFSGHVTSAVPMLPEQVGALEKQVCKQIGAAQLELDFDVNPDLLGGFIVHTDDWILDYSLRGRLTRLRRRLANT